MERRESSTAVVFPGQGSQRDGMGRDFHDAFATARDVFDEASEAVQLDLRGLCFGADPRLARTEYAQPAIVTTEIAMFRVLQAEFGLVGRCFGGHSLGEYAALVAAGALPLAATVRAVRERGRLMQEAVSVGEGKMIALIGAGLDLSRIGQTARAHQVTVANENSPEQIVLSGLSARVWAAAQEILSGQVGLRTVELDVSAPFHSPFMRAIEPAFGRVLGGELADALVAPLAAVVTANVTGGFHRPERESVLELLLHQVSHPVRWVQNMRALVGCAERVVEIGAQRPLRGFFRAIGVETVSISSVRAAGQLTCA